MQGSVSDAVADLIEVRPVQQAQTDFRPPNSTFTNTCGFSFSCIPETKNQLNKLSGLPLGVLFSPFLGEDPPLMRKAPVRCDGCRGYVNCYCNIDLRDDTSVHWICSFCGRDNVYAQAWDPVMMGGKFNRTDYNDLSVQQTDFLDSTNQPFLGQHTSPFYYFLVDGNINQEDMKVCGSVMVMDFIKVME